MDSRFGQGSRCRQALGDGVGFPSADCRRLFDQSLAAAFELSHRLDRVMRHIAHRCSNGWRQNDGPWHHRPSLVSCLAGGAILLSVMLPLLGILSSMGL